MNPGLYLGHKITFRAHGRKVLFIKKPVEHIRHVLMKAFLWAIYRPYYPSSGIEITLLSAAVAGFVWKLCVSCVRQVIMYLSVQDQAIN